MVETVQDAGVDMTGPENLIWTGRVDFNKNGVEVFEYQDMSSGKVFWREDDAQPISDKLIDLM